MARVTTGGHLEMRTHPMLIVVLVVAIILPVSAQPVVTLDTQCNVTLPNGIAAGTSERQDSSFGNASLSTSLWPGGIVVFKPGGPGFVTRDGALGMKFPWTRGVR